jgi:hypothetical protein
MVSRLAPFQHAFVQRLSELGIAYRGSPIVEGPGKRYFDDSLRGGNGIRSRFLLVVADEVIRPSRKRRRGSPHPFEGVLDLRQRSSSEITLVRPDGYVAYSAANHNGIAALEFVRSLLERQTAPRRPTSSALHQPAQT